MGRRTVPSLSDHDMQLLVNYDWPGNVRELQNIIERALILSKGDALEIAPLLFNSTDNKTTPSREERVVGLNECMSNNILSALKKTNGRINGPNGAAELLRIHPNTLRYKMKKLGLNTHI